MQISIFRNPYSVIRTYFALSTLSQILTILHFLLLKKFTLCVNFRYPFSVICILYRLVKFIAKRTLCVKFTANTKAIVKIHTLPEFNLQFGIFQSKNSSSCFEFYFSPHKLPTPTQWVASFAKQKPPPHGRGLSNHYISFV